jgi:ABC-2 type transport system ATP-binding protein
MNVVRTAGVSKRYGPLAALDGVRVEFAENTIHGLFALALGGAAWLVLRRATV